MTTVATPHLVLVGRTQMHSLSGLHIPGSTLRSMIAPQQGEEGRGLIETHTLRCLSIRLTLEGTLDLIQTRLREGKGAVTRLRSRIAARSTMGGIRNRPFTAKVDILVLLVYLIVVTAALKTGRLKMARHEGHTIKLWRSVPPAFSVTSTADQRHVT